MSYGPRTGRPKKQHHYNSLSERLHEACHINDFQYSTALHIRKLLLHW